MGQVMVVTSGKGGTGKTTLCAGLAAGLAQLDQQVLCIDADIGLRNLDLSLGMADAATVPFTEALGGGTPLSAAPRHPLLPRLALLTAPVRTAPVDGAAFRALLAQARESFDWILIDAPAGIGEGFRLSSAYADRALVVATADPASLRDAGRAAQLLRRPGTPPLPAQVAVNRVSRKLFRQMGATVDDVMDQIGLPLAGLVPEDPCVVLAAAAGVPLLQYETHNTRGAAAALRRMARRLMGQSVPLMRIR